MKMISILPLALTILSSALFPGGNAAAQPSSGIDMSGIPPARTAQEALERFEVIKQLLIELQSSGQVNPFNGNGLGFTTSALAKLSAGKDVNAINQVLLDSATTVYAKTGTDFHDIFFCQRTGDYDFGLRGLVALMYQFGDKPWLIFPETRRKILDVLLSKRGNVVETTFKIGICGRHAETENHILMTESSRYLTNQLLKPEAQAQGTDDARYDNERNGMNTWMLRHLQQFFMHDFYEYNSHPYQAYTLMAIENLAEYAADDRVKLAAEMLLNYLDAKYATSSNNLRRYAPFRRQPSYHTQTALLQMDDESQRFILMSDATELFDELPKPHFLETGTDRMFIASLGKYRTPEIILDLIVNRDHANFFQAFHHSAIEIYASSKSFLLSAGGIPVTVWDFGSDQMNGWAMPTTLIPTHGGWDASEFVRFMGQTKDTARINTCVSPGFACGLNPSIPAFIPKDCQQTAAGGWTFFDFTSNRCPLKYGFFAALYSAPCDSSACRKYASTYGFLEASEPSAALDFQAFKQKVLDSNARIAFHSNQENEYFATSGHRIRFNPIPNGKLDWSIRSIDGNPMVTDMTRWPLAFGDIIRADAKGLIEIRNPYLHRQLRLDMRDPLHPSRQELLTGP